MRLRPAAPSDALTPDPCGVQNELRYLRVRAKKQEIMVAFGTCFRMLLLYVLTPDPCPVDVQFIVIVVQRWAPSGE